MRFNLILREMMHAICLHLQIADELKSLFLSMRSEILVRNKCN